MCGGERTRTHTLPSSHLAACLRPAAWRPWQRHPPPEHAPSGVSLRGDQGRCMVYAMTGGSGDGGRPQYPQSRMLFTALTPPPHPLSSPTWHGHRPIVHHAMAQRGALPHAVHRLDHRAAELLHHAALHEEALAPRAVLAAVQERGLDSCLDNLREEGRRGGGERGCSGEHRRCHSSRRPLKVPLQLMRGMPYASPSHSPP